VVLLINCMSKLPKPNLPLEIAKMVLFAIAAAVTLSLLFFSDLSRWTPLIWVLWVGLLALLLVLGVFLAGPTPPRRRE
jgi:hypothetical protein